MFASTRSWFVIFLVAIVALLAGYSLLFPAGEGFDEVRHYSYVSELATTGRIPNLLKDTLDRTWQQQHRDYPVHYSGGKASEIVDGPTYEEFFERTPAQRREGVDRWYRGGVDSDYQRGNNLNSAGEHPPLYYLFLVPFFLLAKAWSFGDRLILLRLASVALVGFSMYFFWLIMKEEKDKGVVVWLLAGTVLALTPSFFFDLARAGTDSMCILLGSISAWLLLKLFREGFKTSTIVWLGIVLGLGGLTKLFFVPVMAGVVLGIAVFGYARYGWKRVLLACAIIIGLFLAICGWWYVRNHVLYGSWTGARDFIVSTGARPVVSLATYLKEMAHSALSFARSHVFSSTWSFIFIASWLFAPFAALWIIALGGAGLALYKGPSDPRNRTLLFLVVLAPLFAAFAYHSHHFILSTGRGGVTPGYYPFIIWIILYGLVGIGLARLPRRGWLGPGVLGVLLGCMWVVGRLGDWTLLMVYSGLGTKGAGSVLVGAPFPPGGTWTGIARLNELMPTWAGVPLWAAGVVAQGILIWALLYMLMRPFEGLSLDMPAEGAWFQKVERSRNAVPTSDGVETEEEPESHGQGQST